ncbi:MAG: adenylate/guanylate cyclase domain-containing protein [Bacteroidia bacterium]|nr:adenylate/guanylate cyclase domain-containing protein [Bacteroidia bacterium]
MNRDTLSTFLERGFYGVVVGVVYAWINLKGGIELFLICMTIGFSIGFFTGLLERGLHMTRLRRQQFLVVLFVRSLANLAVIVLSILLVLGAYRMISGNIDLTTIRMQLIGWVRDGNFVYVVFYALVVLVLLQFITLVSRLLGPKMLINYLVGRYHTPQEEDRIFMFMDLRASTTIAERLGHLKWHQFLNDFFFDIGRPIRRAKGEVYQYVGDEVVISWPAKVGAKNLNCIHCFFWIWHKMYQRREYYLKKYGYEPVFKAGYHVGKVIVGEIGDYTRDIVFHGDTVNTASRIQMECNVWNRRLLLSDTLLNRLELGKEYTSEYITNIRLRGKNEELGLYSLDPVKPIPMPTPVAPEE